ncbi:MAG: hypothetical protein JWP78_376 [Mucilaginibacter sp.]|nr:hypothetical protein [Mucilaginibacter sp.]
MKNYLDLAKSSFVILILFFSVNSLAQSGFGASAFSRMSEQAMTNQMMKRAYVTRYKKFIAENPSLLGYLRGYKKYATVLQPYYLRVFFKDSTKFFVTSFLYPDTIKHSCYIVVIDKSKSKNDPTHTQRIYPSQTVGVVMPYQDGGYIYGKATDSCWLFRIIKGKINAYSFAPHPVDGILEPITSYQIDDDAMRNFVPADLGTIVGSDEKAYEAFKDENYELAITLYNQNHK